MLVTRGVAVLAMGRSRAGAGSWVALWIWQGMGGFLGPCLPDIPGMGLSHPACFLCALKNIFALSEVRKKYSDMVEKRYLHTLVGRKGEGLSGRGASQAPASHHSWLPGETEPRGGRQESPTLKLGCCVTLGKVSLSPGWVFSHGTGWRVGLGSYIP